MIAFIFSGQGAQKTGMGSELARVSFAAQSVYRDVSRAVQRDIAALCFSAPQGELNQTINTQIAMFATDLAAMAALREAGIAPGVCAGFSLGEYAALVCAGVLPLNEAARLVETRAQIMSRHQSGGMAAVLGMDADRLEALCREVKSGYVAPVNYNCPGQTVVAGEDAALAELTAVLKEQKARVLPLKVSGAFHSDLMSQAARELRPALEKTPFSTGKIPVLCNVGGDVLQEGENWADALFAQVYSPVRWEPSIRNMLGRGVTAFVECGHGKVLAGLNKRICPDVPSYFVQDEATLNETVAALKV